jgi:hypothetical protein
VPDIRLAYRNQTLVEELDLISGKGVGRSLTQSQLNIPKDMLPTADIVAAKAMAGAK